MQCVILAGGVGMRMRPWTERVPKTLLPVAQTPFAHFQLSWLAECGVTEVLYSIGFLGELVQEFVGDGRRWGLAVDYVNDGPQPAGTAGALRCAFDAGRLHDWFLVLYGDSFLPMDFRPFAAAFLTQERPALMAVYHNQGRLDTGNVRFADGVVQLYKKAQPGEDTSDRPFIDYGVSALRRELIAEFVPAGARQDLADVYHALSVAGRLAGSEVQDRFYEVGSPAGLRDFEVWVAAHAEETWAHR